MNGIKLFVGLGNPGTEYDKTRHNAGFWWIDYLCEQTSTILKFESKFFGLAGKLNMPGEEAWLLKPNTFMNNSGRSVSALSSYYKIPHDSILVVHDELDLPPGTVKLKLGGGNGGHNGLKDISSSLNTQQFWRLRLGIGHPGERNEVVNFVLHAPTKNELTDIQTNIIESSLVLSQLLKGSFEEAMLKLHTKKN